MKPVFAVACLAAFTLAAPASATPDLPADAPVASVFAELEALGFDLAKFRPDFTGRFPYR